MKAGWWFALAFLFICILIGTCIGENLSTPTYYPITVTAGQGGGITPYGAVQVAAGGNSTFTIMPMAGYQVASVIANGINIGAVTNYTFTNVQGPQTISATFSPIPPTQYTITASAGQGGSINPSGSVQVVEGSSQTFTITPNEGYLMSSVTVDGVNKDSVTSYTFTNVQGPHTISVTFSPIPLTQYTITATAGQGGSINPSGSVQVAEGSSQTFTITPNAGYQVSSVVVNGANIGAVTSYTFDNIHGSHSIYATFSPLSAIQYTITATVGQGGSINPSGSVQVAAGSSQTFTITPNAGYQVNMVKIDGNNWGDVNNYTFTNVQAPHSIYTTFSKLSTNKITLTLEPGWNFISAPRSLKDGFDNLDSVIGSTDTANHSVYLFDASNNKWTILQRTSKVMPLDGIWVFSNSENQANFVINDVNEKPSKSIYKGWNAVGCTALDQKSAKDNFYSISDMWTTTLGFNASNQIYETSIINGGSGTHSDSIELVPGKGYWVYSTDEGTLQPI